MTGSVMPWNSSIELVKKLYEEKLNAVGKEYGLLLYELV